MQCATANPDGKTRALVIGGGIANFTDVAATFNGIIRALKEKVKQRRERNKCKWLSVYKWAFFNLFVVGLNRKQSWKQRGCIYMWGEEDQTTKRDLLKWDLLEMKSVSPSRFIHNKINSKHIFWLRDFNCFYVFVWFQGVWAWSDHDRYLQGGNWLHHSGCISLPFTISYYIISQYFLSLRLVVWLCVSIS